MNIVKTNKELDKKDIYKMTLSPAIKRMRDCVGSVIPVINYCIYTDKKSDGDEMTIVDIMGDESFDIEVISGTSKNGREFITCALV